MRKLLFMFVLCLTCFKVNAQIGASDPDTFFEVNQDFNEAERYEHARYVVKKSGENAYYTDLNFLEFALSKETLYDLKKEMYQKEGIFRLELLEDGKKLRVFHLYFIEIETIKAFVIPHSSSFYADERVICYFN